MTKIYSLILILFSMSSIHAYAADDKVVLFNHYIGENIKNNLETGSKYMLISGNPLENNYIDNDFKSPFFSELILTTNPNNEVSKIKAISYPNNFYNSEDQCFKQLKEKASPLKNYYKEEDSDNKSSFVFGDSISFLKGIVSENNEKNLIEKISNLLNGNIINLKCENEYSYFYKRNVYFISYELSNIKTLLNTYKQNKDMTNQITNLFNISFNNDGLTNIPSLSYGKNPNQYNFIPTNQYQNLVSYEITTNPSNGNIIEIKGISAPVDKEMCFKFLKEGEKQISDYYSKNIYSRSNIDLTEVTYTIFDNDNNTNLNISCEQKNDDVNYFYSIYMKKNLL